MTQQTDLSELGIRSLLEGAYAQTDTLPGFWIKYDEFRTKFNELVAERYDTPLDVEALLTKYFPTVSYMDSFQIDGTDEVFKAFRIAPNKLTITKDLKKQIEKAIREIASNDEGWKPLSAVGSKVKKADFLAMGLIGIRQGIERLFGDRYEFRFGDTAKHEDPVQIRDRKSPNEIKREQDIVSRATRSTAIPKGVATKPRQGSFIGKEIDEFAFFPTKKDSTNFGWDAAVNDLAINIALDERWYYEEKDKQVKPILKNYLSYTFARLQYEDEQERKAAATESRMPRLKILTNKKNAVWNTGLVDNIYDPIYAFFQKNDGRNPTITQPWVFVAFATANSYQQKIITDFPYKPERAQYFNDPRELFYDTTAHKPTLDWQHFIKENVSRLPQGFIKRGAPAIGFQFADDPATLPKAQRDDYYARLSEAIYKDDDWLQFLTTKFRNALEVALSRVAWNYKTAIPVYYAKDHKMQLLLPLALEKKDTIDVALVCNHKYNEEEGVNNYEGRTIFTLQMAYNNARLITRPDSDWLMANMCEH